MRLRLAALAVCVVACVFTQGTASAESPSQSVPLTLDDAIARVEKTHPELRLFGNRTEMLVAERDNAALKPPVMLGVQVENALGSGYYSGIQNAEVTLTLASVLERGGKLDARQVLAQRRIDALAIERETRRLDLLAEVARRYLAVATAKAQYEIAEIDILQRKRAVAGARERLQAGASPESVVLTAQAALAKAELSRDRARQQEAAATIHLASLWGERNPQFTVVAGNPIRLPDIATSSELDAMLERNPELEQFADERRIREARLQLAKSSATADLEWQVGFRRIQATDDNALVAAITLPLGGGRRAEPGIRSAQAELSALEVEREAKGMSLYSTLMDAHGRYIGAQREVRVLQDIILPKLARAESAAERAYRAGAISYMEWAQLQSERTATRRQQLDVAIEAQRALIEIQRLTGQAFIATKSDEQGATP